jgi:uncharacterized protein
MKAFFEALYILAIDMGFYMIIGLLLVTVFNVIIKKEWIAAHLGKGNLWSIIKASIFGVPLPLCSCGVVPTGMYLKDKGASDASTASFLISTPQTGVDSIVATYGLMGITFAWFRPIAAFVSGVFGGLMVKVFGKSKDLDTKKEHIYEEDCTDGSCSKGHTHSHEHAEEKEASIGQKLKASFKYAFGDFVGDIAFHFILGLIVAALITVLIPANFLVEIGLSSGILAMLVMIVVGAPMYICSTSSIPIALSLIAKGLSPGTAFVFLFMGPFTNIATISILGKKIGTRTTIIYLVSAALSAIGFGYLLDFLIGSFSLPFISGVGANAHAEDISIYKVIIGLSFMLIIFYHIVRRISAWFKAKGGAKEETATKSISLKVSGMNCDGCANSLKADFLNTKGVKGAKVSFDDSSVKVWGNFEEKDIVDVVLKKGYSII